MLLLDYEHQWKTFYAKVYGDKHHYYNEYVFYKGKLFKLLDYLKQEWGDNVADSFISRLQKRLHTLSQQLYIGVSSIIIKSVHSILITKLNRLFYQIKGDTIEVLNMYDTRSNQRKILHKS